MNSRERAADKQRRLEQAIFPLLGDPRFQSFMELLEEMKDEAVSYYVDNDSIKDERLSMASRGEVRAYLTIIAVRDTYLQRQEQIDAQREEMAERERTEIGE
jgi:hypothetical protein